MRSALRSRPVRCTHRILLPRYRRHLGSASVADLRGSLTDDFHCTRQRKQQHPVGIEVAAHASGDEALRRFDGFHHVSKARTVIRRHTEPRLRARPGRENAG
jgi:hypothetical protein